MTTDERLRLYTRSDDDWVEIEPDYETAFPGRLLDFCARWTWVLLLVATVALLSAIWWG